MFLGASKTWNDYDRDRQAAEDKPTAVMDVLQVLIAPSWVEVMIDMTRELKGKHTGKIEIAIPRVGGIKALVAAVLQLEASQAIVLNIVDNLVGYQRHQPLAQVENEPRKTENDKIGEGKNQTQEVPSYHLVVPAPHRHTLALQSGFFQGPGIRK